MAHRCLPALVAGCVAPAAQAPPVAPPVAPAAGPDLLDPRPRKRDGPTAPGRSSPCSARPISTSAKARRASSSSSAPACVLDVYLYPPRGGGDPVVTHVDARLPDGRDMDRSSCVAALSRRAEAR